ncbi:membrane protein [Pseudomonas syringae]|uniref:Membrane protein n=1 Tax=Pseudomonas syringae TaxID=317 RepID=A0A1C7ZAT4_PSESX|nr:DUF1206 domain-containing protein [Pseudomonas syringae]OCR26953.1 membrane protein [Pseudomonas syringae]
MSPNRGLVLLARGGYAARGLVYLIIGAFALLAALGSGQPTDSHSSLEKVLSQPFGHVLVGIVVVGLIAFAAWRLLQATRDVDHHGTGFKGIAIRAGLLAGAVSNALLAFFALSLLISGLKSSGGSQGGKTEDFLATLLSWDHSNLLIYLAALVPLVVGIIHIVKGWKATFEKYFEADEQVMRYVRPISRFGLIARGVAFIEIAALLAISGSSYEAMHPPGMKDAMKGLQSLPMGWLVLSVVAVGLMAFAVYSFAEARWRKINMDVPDAPHALKKHVGR